MSAIFDKTSQALNQSLNFRQLRQNVISANIANAETPGYKAKVVDFEGALADALQQATDAGLMEKDPGGIADAALERVQADVYDNPDVAVSNDGNTVDVEREMVSLTENSTLYRAAVQLMNKKIASLKYAASEGGR